MYKRRLKKWGYDCKYNRFTDIVETLRLKKTRDSACKRSEFFVRGQKVQWDKVERYVKRNPSVKAVLHGGLWNANDPSCSREVTCRTPPPGEPGSLPSPRILRLSGETGVALQLVHATNGYVNGAMDGVWFLQDNEMLLSRRHGTSARQHLDIWESATVEGLELVKNGDFRQGFRVLDMCCAGTGMLLQEQDPELLPKMIKFALGIPSNCPDLLVEIQRHFAGTSAKMLGPRHPISVVWGLLQKEGFTEFHSSIRLTLRSMIECMETSTGVTRTSFALRRRLIRFSGGGQRRPVEEVVMELYNLIELGRKSPSITWEDIFRAGVDLCKALQSARNMLEAKQVLKILYQWISLNQLLDLESESRVLYEYLWTLLNMCDLLQEFYTACEVSHVLLELCEQRYGHLDGKTVCALACHRRCLTRLGIKDEAKDAYTDWEWRACRITLEWEDGRLEGAKG